MYSFRKSLATPAGLLAASMLLVSLVAAGNSVAQDKTKTPVEGVWKIAEVVVPAGGSFQDWAPGGGRAEKDTTITNPQPGLIIFTRGHYSQLVVRGQQPRAAVAPPKDPQNLTADEKTARYEQWRLVIANAGTCQVKGSTLLIRVMVAKNVDWMTREKPIEVTFKLDGRDTLWLIGRSATEPRFKLTRLE